MLGKASREACDTLDGVEDGVIDDPTKCTADVFDLNALQCPPDSTENCLTAGQLQTARYMYEDVVDADGNVPFARRAAGLRGRGRLGDLDAADRPAG